MPIRIHIADDHAVFRCGLKAFIEKQGGCVVVGETGTAAEAREWLQKNTADVLILDLNMPGTSVHGLVRELVTGSPDLGILILTMHDEKRYLREFLELGVKGFMVKSSTGPDLIQAIQAVHSGREYIDPAMSKHLISGYLGRDAEQAKPIGPLTRREHEVCKLLALGHTNAEAAEVLSISKRTVESHRASLMEKLKLTTRAELVRFAMDNDLL